MYPLIVIAAIIAAATALLCIHFFGIALLIRLFGQERVERYLKMRTQGPFVPTPEDRRSAKK